VFFSSRQTPVFLPKRPKNGPFFLSVRFSAGVHGRIWVVNRAVAGCAPESGAGARVSAALVLKQAIFPLPIPQLHAIC
jgi:hypothetical protein